MNSLMEGLINYLFKKKIMKLSKIEDSFFLHKSLDKKIKLTTEIIHLNYLKESPYPMNESAVSSVLIDNDLYLWFVKEQGRYLPEAILLYRSLTLEHSSVLCIIKDDIDKTLVIKNNILVSSFAKKKITNADIHLIKDEYGVDKVVNFDVVTYKTLLKKSYKNLKFNDLLNILNIQIDFKKLWIQSIKWIALPLFITTILLVLLLGVYSLFLEDDKNKLHEEYKKNKLLSSNIKKNIESNEDESIQFNLLAKEVKYHEKTLAISNIIHVTKDMNMSMQYIKVYDNKVDFIIKTHKQESIPLYVKKLFASKYFLDVKNISSFKLHDKRIQITMTATLREK